MNDRWNHNRHTFFHVLMGLIKSDLATYAIYLEFKSYMDGCSIFNRRMNLFRRVVLTSRPTITISISLEVRTQHLHDIFDSVVTCNVPNKSIQKQPLEEFCKKICSWKFRKIHRKTPVPVPEPQACNFFKKETLAQVFSCEFCEDSKNTFFIEHIWATASVNYQC